MWAKAAGIEDIDVKRGPRFTVESMAIEAAINADGVALVSHSAVVEDLKAGRLVRPFNPRRAKRYRLLACLPPQSTCAAQKSGFFCEWLLAEASKSALKETSALQ